MSGYRISRVTTPATSLALITLAQAKAVLGVALDDTSQDAAITQQIDQVSAAINNHCDRVLPRQEYEDQFRSVCARLDRGEPLRTRQFPIGTDIDDLPLLTVTQDGVLLDETSWEVDIESGALYRIDSGGAAWTGNLIVVDYTGGYDPIPADVQGAALEWINARWASRGRDPMLRSETIPDQISHSWGGDPSMSSMPGITRDWLSKYVLWSA